MQCELVIAWAPCLIISPLSARYSRAELMISSRVGSTIFLAWLSQYSSASASAALRSIALWAAMTSSLVMGITSVPSFFLTSSIEHAAAVPRRSPTARIFVCRIRGGDPHQAHHPVQLAPIAGGQQDHLLARPSARRGSTSSRAR